MTDTATKPALSAALTERLAALDAVTERGDTGAVKAAARLRAYLSPDRLLPVSAVAAHLGVASPLIIEPLVVQGDIRGVQRDGEYFVPFREVERVQDDPKIQYLRERDRLHDQTAGFGDKPMSKEELEILAAG